MSRSRETSTRFATKEARRWQSLNSVLTALTILSAIASLLGISVLGILSRVLRAVYDPWQISTGVAVAILIPFMVITVRGFVAGQALRATLGEELHGRTEVTSQERLLVQEASSSIAYVAGDFSHIHDIHSELLAAHDRNVTVRILAARSASPAIHANLAQAVALHCEVRLYERDFRRVKALIIDPDEPQVEGAVLFVRKVARHDSHDTHGQGLPGNDEDYRYVGTIYTDRLLVTAIGQMFDAWWQRAQPFAP
jgi:hypothetical protein